MTHFIQITVAAANRDEAERIARELVERRLAGCVQTVGPVRSVYRWQGQIEQADEWLCLIKTTRACYDAVEAAILALHSYESPEIIAAPIETGSAAYLQWLLEQTADG